MKALSIVIGIVYVILGIICMTVPAATTSVLTYLISAIVFIAGLWLIISYFTKKDSFNFIEHSGWTLAFGIISCLLGIAMFIWPIMTTLIMTEFFIGYVTVAGIFRIITAISSRGENSSWGWTLFFGIIMTIAGAFLLFHPLMSIMSMGIALAIALIVSGINYIVLGCSV